MTRKLSRRERLARLRDLMQSAAALSLSRSTTSWPGWPLIRNSSARARPGIRGSVRSWKALPSGSVSPEPR